MHPTGLPTAYRDRDRSNTGHRRPLRFHLRSDGTTVDFSTYGYRRAARDTLHFSKLVDRFVQNLRRVAGFDVQYFASVEPQRRLAPHLHVATRGTLPRAELRQIAAATYHQVWWPAADTVRYEGENLPVWEESIGGYVDMTTGQVLPTWTPPV